MLGDQRRAGARQRLGERAALAAARRASRSSSASGTLALAAVERLAGGVRPARRAGRSRRARSTIPVQHGLRPRRSRSRLCACSTPASSVSAPAAHVDRGAGVEHGQRRARLPRLPSRTVAQHARVALGRARGDRAVAGRLEPDLLRRDVVQRPAGRRSARPRGWCPKPRTRRVRRRSTLPGRARVPSSPSAAAIVSRKSGSETPITWRVAPAGLVSGPRKLKIVRTAERLAHRDDVLHRRVVARART